MRREQRRHLRRRRDGGPERLAPDCALLCGECGQLSWPQARAAGSMRQDESTALARQPPCSHCNERAWIDLGMESAALALREDEQMQVRRRRDGLVPVVVRSLYGAAVGALLGFMLIGELWGVLVVGSLLGFIVGLKTASDQQLLHRPPTKLPARWAMALPAAPGTDVHVGPAKSAGDRLTAPLSGRRCVAYEVAARYDDDAGASLDSWALVEQKVGAIEVDGHAVPASTTHLELSRTHLGSSSSMSLSEAGTVFLAQRGLVLDGMVVELFESIIEEDSMVELRLGAEGARLRPTAGAVALRPAATE